MFIATNAPLDGSRVFINGFIILAATFKPESAETSSMGFAMLAEPDSILTPSDRSIAGTSTWEY